LRIPDRRFSKNLNALRALGCIFVAIAHTGHMRFAWYFVQAFFVLSSYFISQEILSPEPWKSYAWKRLVRVLPSYLFYLAPLAIAFPDRVATKLPYLLTFTFNYYISAHYDTYDPLITHLWTISVDVQFYVVWFIVLRLLGPRARVALMLAVVVASPLLRMWFTDAMLARQIPDWGVGQVVYWLTFLHLDAFAMATLVVMYRDRISVRMAQVTLLISLGCLLAIGIDNILVNDQRVEDLGLPAGKIYGGMHIWGYTAADISLAALVLVLRAKDEDGSAFSRMFGSWYLQKLGLASYVFYLIHWPLLHLKILWFGNPSIFSPVGAGGFLIYLAATSLAAFLLYELVEKRFARFRLLGAT